MVADLTNPGYAFQLSSSVPALGLVSNRHLNFSISQVDLQSFFSICSFLFQNMELYKMKDF